MEIRFGCLAGLFGGGGSPEQRLIDPGAGLAGGADDLDLAQPAGVFGDRPGDRIANDCDDVGGLMRGVIEGCLPGLVVVLADHALQRAACDLDRTDVVGYGHHDGHVPGHLFERDRKRVLKRDAGCGIDHALFEDRRDQIHHRNAVGDAEDHRGGLPEARADEGPAGGLALEPDLEALGCQRGVDSERGEQLHSIAGVVIRVRPELRDEDGDGAVGDGVDVERDRNPE
jgi:hypothetical protein